jgi:hypothetical protein
MEEKVISFTVRVDSGNLPFTKYNVFDNAEKSVNQVEGWENAIRDGVVNIRPAANFPAEIFTVLSLTVTVSVAVYNLIKNIQKERKEKAALESKKIEKYLEQQKLKLSIEEIQATRQLVRQLESLKEQMEKFGTVDIEVDDVS